MTPVVEFREAVDGDWPQICPFFRAIVAEGHSYAFPDDLSREEARSWWMERPPGRTVVAFVDGEIVGTVPGAFHHPEHGDVGLHVMFRRV